MLTTLAPQVHTRLCVVRLTGASRRLCFLLRKSSGAWDRHPQKFSGKSKEASRSNWREASNEYSNKLMLAPMDRVSTLPFRLLAAEYGADITYGEEIIDHKFLNCECVINESLGTTDFLERGTDNVVFQTCPQERSRVIFQMAISDAVRALKAAQIVCKDVAAIDIYMDCPKSFSLSGGMGAPLLSKPELIHDVLHPVALFYYFHIMELCCAYLG